MIDVEQRTVSVFRVGAYLGRCTTGVCISCRRPHPVPSCGTYWPTGSQIAQITLEVWQLRDGFHLFQNALLAAAYDEFAWCAEMVQKAHPPKHPRCRLTENFIMSYAGIRFPLYLDGAGACMASRKNGRVQLPSKGDRED